MPTTMQYFIQSIVLGFCCFNPPQTLGQNPSPCELYSESHARNFYSMNIAESETGYQRDTILFLFQEKDISVINEFKKWASSNEFVVSMALSGSGKEGEMSNWILVKHKLEKEEFYYAYYLIDKVAQRKDILKIYDCGSIAYK